MSTTDIVGTIAFIERTYGGAYIGKDFPDMTLELGGIPAVEALVDAIHADLYTPRSVWRWLRQDLTAAEAFMWLGVDIDQASIDAWLAAS